MKLTIILADAATGDPVASALRMGLTRISAKSFPTEFTGAVLVVVDPEEGDEPGSRGFRIMVRFPGAQESMTIGSGEFILGEPREQIVIAGKNVRVPLEAPGEYIFRVESDQASAETHIIASELEVDPS